MTYHEVEQGTPAWHELRNGRVTASNADVLLLKNAKEAINANSKSFSGNFYTDRGHSLEPQAVDLYERISDRKVKSVGFVTNDKYPNAGFSPDGVCESYRRFIEVKAFGADKHRRARVEIPFEVMAQIQFGLMIMEFSIADLVLYNPDLEASEALHIIPVERDERIINHIKRKLES